MNHYKLIYDLIEDFDVEYSHWKRVVVAANEYDEAMAKFDKKFPGNRIFSIDLVEWDMQKQDWQYV